MKFYIASKFENKERVLQIKKYLIDLGFNCTYDWTNCKETDIDFQLTGAINDLNGVKSCDFLVGIFEEEHQYKGAIAEVGMAIALGKRIFILGDWLDNMVFMALPNITKIDNINQIINIY